MNTNITFTLYADAAGAVGPVPIDHTYVTSSDNHNWNCFGRGAGSGGRVLRSVKASSKWAALIYGQQYEGSQDCGAPAGLAIRHSGVCQNVANRILVLGNADASGSFGNALATVMYGKFGFNIPQYIEIVKSTGDQLLKSDPGEITQQDIDTVLGRIAYGQTPDAELDILHADLDVEENKSLPDVTEAQRNAFRPIYSDYQKQRADAFATVDAKSNPSDQFAFGALKDALIAPWTQCVTRLITTLGPDQFQAMFGVSPEIATKLMGGL